MGTEPEDGLSDRDNAIIDAMAEIIPGAVVSLGQALGAERAKETAYVLVTLIETVAVVIAKGTKPEHWDRAVEEAKGQILDYLNERRVSPGEIEIGAPQGRA